MEWISLLPVFFLNNVTDVIKDKSKAQTNENIS